MSNNKALEIKISRKKGKTTFSYEVASEVGEIYKEASSGLVGTSKNWPGLDFYQIKSLKANEFYKEKLSQYNLMDEFGSPLINDNKLNIAWLRTVGGKGVIVIEGDVPLSKLTSMTKDTISFLRDYFKDVLADVEIEGSLSTSQLI